LHASHPAAAWTLTALGAYAALWLVGHDRATAARAIAVDGDGVALRVGLRLTARVPSSHIAEARVVAWTERPAPAPGYLDAARPIEPNVVVRFVEPVIVTGAIGARRRVTSIGVAVDEPERLVAAIERASRGAGTARNP